MVSTTLTTSAAGQPTSSSNHCHSSATLTATNANYQRALQQQLHHHSSALTRSNCYFDTSTVNGPDSDDRKVISPPAFHAAAGPPAPESCHHSANPHRYSRPASKSTSLYTDGSSQYHSSASALSPTAAETTKPDLISSSATQTSVYTKSTRHDGPTTATSQPTTTTKTATAAPSIKLTKTLLSTSPPLTEQLSLLFPKCRPKQHVNNTSSPRSQHSNDSETADVNSKEANGDERFPADHKELASDSVTSPTKNSSASYYRTVNIITQSPPPHSTSSVSSESLSSVTPRISTNPFLCPSLSTNINGETATNNQLNEADEANLLDNCEELPLRMHQTFYYNSSNVEDQNHHPLNNYTMPRKRLTYYHQQQQQPSAQHCAQSTKSDAISLESLHHQLSQQHHSANNGANTSQQRSHVASSQSQNPFIKDNYWETRHNITPASSELNSPEQSSNSRTEMDKLATHPSSRRVCHQQTHSSSSSHCIPRQQYHVRVGRSPIAHSEQYEPLRRGGERLQHSQSHQQQYHADVSPNRRTSLYPFGSKSSLERHIVDWDDQHELRDRASRERERGEHRSGTDEKEREDQRELERDHPRYIRDLILQPNEQQPKQQKQPMSEGRLSVIADGEVVIFDDIAESWKNLRVTTDPSSAAAPAATKGVSSIPRPTTKEQQQPGLTSAESKDGNIEQINKSDMDSKVAVREHKKYIDRNYAITVETRHGIIEYDGSPRRIGQGAGSTTPDDEPLQAPVHPSDKYSYNASTSAASNSPQQYPARPGFPQRILSPARVVSPLLPLLNTCKKQQPQQQQQPQSQPPQQSPVDNNAEDTSNDVSEIGTLSDMTTPEVTSTAAPTAGVETSTATSTPIAPPPTTMPSGSTGVSFSLPAKSSTFDYLYEFSETRKVLEEFFKCPSNDDESVAIENGSDVDSIDIQYEFHSNLDGEGGDGVADEELDIVKQEQEENEQLQQQLQLQLMQHKEQQQQQQHHHQHHLNHKRHNNINHHRRHYTSSPLMRDFDFFLESASRSSGEQIDQDGVNHNQVDGRNNYRYSPETTDYDSNCGDLDSLSGELNGGISTSCSNYTKYYASSMPVLEDGLSSGHTSDTENNNNLQQSTAIHHAPGGGISMLMDMKRISTNNSINSANNTPTTTAIASDANVVDLTTRTCISPTLLHDTYLRRNESPLNSLLEDSGRSLEQAKKDEDEPRHDRELLGQSPSHNNKVFKNIDPDLDSLYSISVFQRPDVAQSTPPPPAPAPHRKPNTLNTEQEILQPIPYKGSHTSTNTTPSATTASSSVTSAISSTFNRTKFSQNLSVNPLQIPVRSTQSQQPPPIPERNAVKPSSPAMNSPIWVPRHLEASTSKSLLESTESHSKNMSGDEDEVDTDLETDRLLGHQRLDDHGYYDENKSWDRKSRSLLSKISPKQQHTKTRNGYNALLSTTPEIPPPPPLPPKNSSKKLLDIGGSMSSPEHSEKSAEKSSLEVEDCIVTAVGSPIGSHVSGCGSLKKDISSSAISNGNAAQTSGLNNNNNNNNNNCVSNNASGEKKVKKSKNKEGGAVLIEGVLFRARYLGSTQLVCEGQPTKSTRMMQAEEAVSRIKAPDGDVQPSTEVDLFISTEKIMVLNTDLKEIMMDHALRTISYIADIGDLVVLMARRRFVPQDIDDAPKPNRTPKMICHVFESDEAQFIAQSIGQAFQVAYMEFLKANGIEDHSFVKEMDYQEVLNSQEIFGDELEIFAKKELQKEVVVPKAKGEILGVVIVESGWGSMLPTVVIANLMSTGAAARCGQLNIGDQLIAINGMSLVGLPLSTCQTYIKNTKNQTVVKFTVVPCAPVVEVKIKRPNTKYQLGFSVQNGVICSLLRGGIAERGGVRVGHRIIEINNQSVVAVPHEKIVNLLATSVGEILMKTMPTSMFRLLTGQENPIYI